MGFSLDDVEGLKKGTWRGFAQAEAVNVSVNTYARVEAISDTSITVDLANQMQSNLIYTLKNFAEGEEVFFHVSASRNGDTAYLGKWCWATITAINGNLLTLNKKVTDVLPASEFSKYWCQAILVAKYYWAEFGDGCVITPPAYSASTYCGGIVVIKTNGNFYFKGGKIDLTDKGIPVASKALRPWLAQEMQGKLDTDPYSGWENGLTPDRFMLNAGDGACFIVAKEFVSFNSATRIGNLSTKGVLNCRGAADSANKPSGVTNVGGATILLASNYGRTISSTNRTFMFAKYRSTESAEGQGLGRAYWASPAVAGEYDDQGCVSIDTIEKPSRLGTSFNIYNFGDGHNGSVKNPTVCINNYARIAEVSSDRKQLTMKDGMLKVSGAYNGGLEKIQAGALVMVVATSTSTDPAIFRQEHGKMTFAKVLAVTSTKITIDTALPASEESTVWQVISVPQFQNFTLNKTYSLTPNYRGHVSGNDLTGVGGICVLACKGTCDLRGGKIDVAFKGRPSASAIYTYTSGAKSTSDLAGKINYGEKMSNANMTLRFPPGGGDGAVFILAKKIIMDASTRIGNTGTGNKLGGTGIENNVEQAGGGFKAPNSTGGAKGGAGYDTGTGSYACSTDNRMGANVMIIADTIDNLYLANICTGGHGKLNNTRTAAIGGCGYGGGNVAGGGYHGGAAGAGCAGNAFIFCNNAVNQNTSGIIVPE